MMNLSPLPEPIPRDSGWGREARYGQNDHEHGYVRNALLEWVKEAGTLCWVTPYLRIGASGTNRRSAKCGPLMR
jgi:hypothetical protein